MSRPLFAHMAAMRCQIRRIQQATVLATAAMLPCAALLLATSTATWLTVLLVLILAGYMQRKVRRLFWARRAVKQLRLEEQFVRHSPTPEHVRTCLHRCNHLWTQSLTLKGLKTLAEDTAPPSRPADAQHVHIHRHYRRAFRPLHPARLPADLIWATAAGLLWLWFLPEVLLYAMPPPVSIGLALLLLILTAETIQAILNADLRDSFAHFATLLSAWTLAHDFETAFETVHEKPYRHTALYRAWVFTRQSEARGKPNAPPATPPLQPIHLEVNEMLLQAAETTAPLQGHAQPG